MGFSATSRWIRLHATVLLVAAALALLIVAGAQSDELPTPSPSPRSLIFLAFDETIAQDADGSAALATETETAAPSPSPTMSPNSPASPAFANDLRKILRRVGTLPCAEATRSKMFALLYESNVALHDTCIGDSGYQFFPYTGELPTSEQIVGIVKSTACMQLYTAVIQSKFPECDIDYVSVRTAAEVYLRVKKDVDDGRPGPTQAEFYELYNLNRVMNLLNENATLMEKVFTETPLTAAVSVNEITRLMNPIVLLPGVSVAADMTITVTSDGSGETTRDEYEWLAASRAADSRGNGDEPADPPARTPTPSRSSSSLPETTKSSGARRSSKTTAVLSVLAALLLLIC